MANEELERAAYQNGYYYLKQHLWHESRATRVNPKWGIVSARNLALLGVGVGGLAFFLDATAPPKYVHEPRRIPCFGPVEKAVSIASTAYLCTLAYLRLWSAQYYWGYKEWDHLEHRFAYTSSPLMNEFWELQLKYSGPKHMALTAGEIFFGFSKCEKCGILHPECDPE